MLTAGGRFRTQKVLTAEEAAQRAHILKRALYKRPRTLRGKAAFFFLQAMDLARESGGRYKSAFLFGIINLNTLSL